MGIQDIIGCPNAKEYVRYIENNMLPNFLITKADIMHAIDILGPNLGSSKEKTTRTKPSKVILNTCNDLPVSIFMKHGDITLTVDIMYIK